MTDLLKTILDWCKNTWIKLNTLRKTGTFLQKFGIFLLAFFSYGVVTIAVLHILKFILPEWLILILILSIFIVPFFTLLFILLEKERKIPLEEKTKREAKRKAKSEASKVAFKKEWGSLFNKESKKEEITNKSAAEQLLEIELEKRDKKKKKDDENKGCAVVVVLAIFGFIGYCMFSPDAPLTPHQQVEQAESQAKNEAIAQCRQAVRIRAEGAEVDFAWGAESRDMGGAGIWWVRLVNTKIQNEYGTWITYVVTCSVVPKDGTIRRFTIEPMTAN
jgi:hypothetical protein